LSTGASSPGPARGVAGGMLATLVEALRGLASGRAAPTDQPTAALPGEAALTETVGRAVLTVIRPAGSAAASHGEVHYGRTLRSTCALDS